MSLLKKTSILFDRDEDGKILPKEVELETNDFTEEYKGQNIIITPMSRGEVKKLFADIALNKDNDEKDLDAEMIIKHCINPEFTKEDVECMTNSYVSMLVDTIMRESGLNTKKKTKKQSIEEKEDSFGKN